MLVDEIFIPHTDGHIRVPLDERVTVFAGLDATARRRFADMVVRSLAGGGPAHLRVRDSLGEVIEVGPGLDPVGPIVVEGMARRMVVGAHDLGLDEGAPDPVREAERVATTMAHRQLESELAAVEAGAAEAERLRAELATAPWLQSLEPSAPETAVGLEPEAYEAAEQILVRRRAAEELLAATAEAVRSTDPRHRPRGASEVHVHDAGTGLLDAVAELRRLEARRHEAEAIAPDTSVGAALLDELAEARSTLRRAASELQAARRTAGQEIDECDAALAGLVEELGLEPDPDGPAATIARAMARPRAAAAPAPLDPELAQLLARRQAMIRARIAELPDAEDVVIARRRVEANAAHLARLGGPTGTVPVDRVRNALLARAAALRPDGVDCAVPLVLDDPLVRLEPGSRCDLLDVVARISDRTQVIMLTGDPVVVSWARQRAERGEVRLFDLAMSPTV